MHAPRMFCDPTPVRDAILIVVRGLNPGRVVRAFAWAANAAARRPYIVTARRGAKPQAWLQAGASAAERVCHQWDSNSVSQNYTNLSRTPTLCEIGAGEEGSNWSGLGRVGLTPTRVT